MFEKRRLPMRVPLFNWLLGQESRGKVSSCCILIEASLAFLINFLPLIASRWYYGAISLRSFTRWWVAFSLLSSEIDTDDIALLRNSKPGFLLYLIVTGENKFEDLATTKIIRLVIKSRTWGFSFKNLGLISIRDQLPLNNVALKLDCESTNSKFRTSLLKSDLVLGSVSPQHTPHQKSMSQKCFVYNGSKVSIWANEWGLPLAFFF